MKYSTLLLLAAAFSLSACASGPSETTTSSAAPLAVEAIPASGLGPQTLAPGECGLFLWSQTDASRFIFFQRGASDTALMQIGESAATLNRTRSGGTIFGQFMTRQTFTADLGETIDLAITPGEELDGGQRIEGGRLTLTDNDSWQTVTPVLGVRACQPG